MEIRKPRIEEAERIVALQIDTSRRVNGKDYPPEVIEAWVAHRRVDHMQWLINNGQCLVCVNGSDLLGVGIIRDNEIRGLFVSPDHQSRGVGSALLDRMESLARAVGLISMRTDLTVTAIGFYKSKGYEEIERKQQTIGHGQTLAVVSRIKKLSPLVAQ